MSENNPPPLAYHGVSEPAKKGLSLRVLMRAALSTSRIYFPSLKIVFSCGVVC